MSDILFKQIWIPEFLYKWYPRVTLFIGGVNIYVPSEIGKLLASILLTWSLYIFLKRC